MKRFVKLSLFLIVITLCAFQCDEDIIEDPLTSDVSIMSININTNTQEIKLGDTLWLSGEATSY